MEKINIAELLKDCPKGMELDCTMWDNCTFDGIEDVGYINILVKTPTGQIKLSKEGCFVHNCNSAKCVIFPKGKTTWEGFHRPFKDGDIVATTDGGWIGITEGGENNCFIPTYCIIKSYDKFEAYFDKKEKWKFNRLATEEEKQKLFDAIKENGYKWNAKTKTLERLINKNEFVIGATITNGIITGKIISIDIGSYKLEDGNYVFFNEVHNFQLVPNKFDINTLVPFESRILVRDNKDDIWQPAIYGCINKLNNYVYTMNNSLFYHCIPYEGNEHLLGTTNDCDDFYKTWEE